MSNKALEELRKERDELKEKRNRVESEIDEIIKVEFLQEYKTKYENTYWKEVHNKGCKDEICCFYHVKKVKDIWESRDDVIVYIVVCDTFELRGNAFIIKINESDCTALYKTKITASEYKKAKSAMLKKLSEI